MYYKFNIEKSWLNAATMRRHTMPKECAITAIINLEETKSHGTAVTISSMLVGCAKTAT
jgi:hypothetical protein